MPRIEHLGSKHHAPLVFPFQKKMVENEGVDQSSETRTLLRKRWTRFWLSCLFNYDIQSSKITRLQSSLYLKP